MEGFQLPRRSHALHTRTLKIAAAAVAVPDPPKPGPLALKLGGKSINLTGLWFGASMTIWVIALYPLVLTCAITSRLFDPKKRRPMDFMVWLWARCSMLTCLYRPKVTGKEHLPEKGVPVRIVPNHCAYLDILTLSAFMPRPFKYISKIEILRIPFIGWAMGFAKHIAIRRTDRASQLATFKEAVATLQAGNSLVTFPEGTRSKDGRLMDFKKGPFTMAASAGVRVVPVSIVGTHLFQPPSSVLPMAPPRGVRIVVHPPLDAPAKKKEGETMEATKAAVLSALPLSMQPLVPDTAPRA